MNEDLLLTPGRPKENWSVQAGRGWGWGWWVQWSKMCLSVNANTEAKTHKLPVRRSLLWGIHVSGVSPSFGDITHHPCPTCVHCFSCFDSMYSLAFWVTSWVTWPSGLGGLWLLDISSDNNRALLYSLVLTDFNWQEYHLEQRSINFSLKDLIVTISCFTSQDSNWRCYI